MAQRLDYSARGWARVVLVTVVGHLVLDMRARTVRIPGPSTKEEKVLWDLIRGRRQEFEEELRYLENIIADPDHPNWSIAIEDIKGTQKVLAIITAVEKRWDSTCALNRNSELWVKRRGLAVC